MLLPRTGFFTRGAWFGGGGAGIPADTSGWARRCRSPGHGQGPMSKACIAIAPRSRAAFFYF